jgi:hypothetical protein|tara:strand:+ start:6607 stop:7251 length:645 start_codon:yes stop_codon:yes gene_type:complete
MKNLTLLFALGLILVSGCTKDESYKQIEEQTINSVYVLNQLEGAFTWETMLIDELQDSTKRTYSIIDGENAHTDGYYVPSSRDAMTITWSGTQTTNGARGSAEIRQTTPNFSLLFVLETECVTVDGNQAVYGGTITEIKALTGNAPPIGMGWRFYFKVIDSQRMDQIANCTMFASPMSPSLCNAFLPTNLTWSTQGYSEVLSPGFVEVKYLSKH